MMSLARDLAAALDGKRLWHRLEDLASHGATTGGGVSRLALSDEEISARRQIIDWARAAGLAVLSDPAGNLFIRLEGQRADLPPILTGSHIDSQPSGGRFDGTFGTLAALEVLETLAASGARPPRAIEAVAWMNEEASRFAPGMMGSQAFAQSWPLEDILAVKDADDMSVAEALGRVRAAEPDVPVRDLGFPAAAFVEAHIEQGPVLERAGVPIGVVTGIQGTRRYRVQVNGTAGHAGTVPREDRRDALLAAARMIAELDRVAGRLPGLMYTVGMLQLTPGAPSVIPREAYFSIDVRHPEDTAVAAFDEAIRVAARTAAAPCEVEIQQIAEAATLVFPESIRDRIRQSASELRLESIDIHSAAGHDARHLHKICPTGMIFIPCRDGISHSEDEWCRPEDVEAGARVLAHVLVSLAETPLRQ